MRSLHAALLVAGLLSSKAADAYSPCDSRSLADGPLPIGFSQRDFGLVRRACPRTEVGLGLEADAIVENENFYGNVRTALRLDASVQPVGPLELFVTVEPLFYQVVIQSFRDDHLGLGDTSFGATLLAFARDRFALSLMARGTVPTAIGYYEHSFPAGLDGGVLLLVEPIAALRLHAGLLAGTRFAFTKADPDPRGALVGNGGLDLVVADWLSVVLDLNGQALERGGLDHLSAALGLRAAPWEKLSIELGANVPFAGNERSLGAFLLRGSYRF